MPCYFGGRPILTFDDLVGPNPLISQFLYVDQYMELLSRYFNVSKGGWFTETFKDSIEARHLIVDCRVSDQPVQPAKPVRNPERAMARLRDLGISVN